MIALKSFGALAQTPQAKFLHGVAAVRNTLYRGIIHGKVRTLKGLDAQLKKLPSVVRKDPVIIGFRWLLSPEW